MQKTWSINQFLILVTSIAILFVIMKFSADLLAPFLISVALAVILSPLLNYFEKKHIPKTVSLVFIILISFIPIIILGGYIGAEAIEFKSNFHSMQTAFQEDIGKLVQTMNSMGIGIQQADIEAMLSKSNISGIIKSLATQASAQFSNIILIIFTVSFMLMESDYLYNKLKKILSKSKIELKDGMKIIAKINTYFIIKAKTSMMSSVLILAVLLYYDIPYPYLLTALSFFFGFIPVVGDILSTIPAIILAFMEGGVATAMWITLWYVTINSIVGNIIEPRIMSKGLGLSALVVFLSMTLWGWVLGPTGMILSVPLTMAMQFFFAQYEETEWIALMLSDYKSDKGENDAKNDHA
jgi:predicted PurR-regulated permease PerM